MKAGKTKPKQKQQVKLDRMLEKQQQEFTCNGVMEAVIKFVACDDQYGQNNFLNQCADVQFKVLAVADKAVFCNCLVAMRPKAGWQDIPSTHNIATYIHNEFVKWLKELKDKIQVS